MDSTFYIKRNTNNQVAKVNETNILNLDKYFNSEINAQNLVSLLRQIEEGDLGNYFASSKFGKLPLSAKLIKKFALCTLYEIKSLEKEEFNKLSAEQKFEFIISQKTLGWVNLLNKSELVGFLSFCNIHCEISASIVELRNLANSAVKSCRTLEQSTSETSLTLPEDRLIVDSFKNQVDFLNSTFIKDEVIESTETRGEDKNNTPEVVEQLKQLLGDIDRTLSPKVDINNAQLESNIKITDIKRPEQNSEIGNDSGNRIQDNNKKMDFKRIIHKPEYFGGKATEDIESFMDKFEVIAIVNGWKETEKAVILPLYLTDAAESFVKILKIKNKDLTWTVLKEKLIDKFTMVGNKNLLRAQINQRKLKEGETLKEFVIDITQMCYRMDKNIREDEICERILKGLPEAVYEKIGMIDNTTIDKISTNLERYELAKLVRQENNSNANS